ncbi:hypothetical protein IFM89_032567 [Coptis chinensis]|uniref:CCHC-type domain-containing protein n=1 Tax=Coptis chinensis TaxID=261450 RepID=A0A835I5A5_9MAGN|nr:hypothetical protein IFM89_032567 [Coptis chinensis]
MEWSDITTLSHEISDYCIKNRFEVDMKTVNERYRIRAKCKGSYKGKDSPWVAYWKLRPDGFTMRLKTFVNEHICCADQELKNGMADANWVARKITPQMKVQYNTMSPRFIMAEVKRQLHVSISYWIAWHASRLKCLQDIYGDYGASYNMVHVLCDQWQLFGIVCVQAVTVVLYPRRVYWKEYCSSYYWVSTYKLAYMGHIMPMPNMSDWPVNCDLDRQIMPPPHLRGIGMPKKARTRGEDEEVNPKKKRRICSKCKQPRHNAKTYSTQVSQASAPAPYSTQTSQASSSKAAKRVCSKCKQPGHNVKTCKAKPKPNSKPPISTKPKLNSKSPTSTKPNSKVSATKSNAESTPKSNLQTSSSSTPQPATEPATLTFGPPRVTRSTTAKKIKAPEQRHTFGNFLAKQSTKSSTSVLVAPQVAFTDGGTVKAPIETKRPRPHGLGSTPFKPPGLAS